MVSSITNSDLRQMSMDANQEPRGIPLPPNPEDGDVYFHNDLVCQYYKDKNTWACSRVIKPL